MRHRILGRTGLSVSEMALGGLFVSSFGGEKEDGISAIKLAVEAGINYIDTAPSYSNSEDVIGEALRDVSQPLIISTKLGGRPDPFNPKDKSALRKSFEQSLEKLGRDCVDILMIHEPDRPRQWDWWDDCNAYTGPVMELLEELKSEGLIKYTGLGGTTAYEIVPIMRTGSFDVVLTAFNYSLLWREAEIDLISTAVELNMGLIIGSPLQQGSLANRYDTEVREGAPWLSSPRREQLIKLYKMVDECGIPLPELGLRFVLSNPQVSCVLCGARSAHEVEMSVAATDKGPLPKDLLQRLDEIAAMLPFRPFGEPPTLPLGRPYQGPAGLVW